MSCDVGDIFANWEVLDSKPVKGKYLCKCTGCGFEKMVNRSHIFSKKFDKDKRGTKCRNCHRKDVVGERFQTNKGFWYTVLEYNNASDILIKFDADDLCKEGYQRSVAKYYLLNGCIDYPFERSCCSIGYNGYIRSENKLDKTHIHIKDVWSKMLQRCYKPSAKDLNGYKGCIVCDDWHSFLNFSNWYKAQIGTGLYEDGYQLDKDILKRGNKVYCPEYCRLIPEKINSFTNNFEDTRKTGTPNGVNWKEKNKKYQVAIKDEHSKNKYLCITEDVSHGYKVYCLEKERLAKVLADMYDGKVDPDIINALRNFKCPKWDNVTKSYIE